MNKKLLTLMISIIILIVGFCGCTEQTATQQEETGESEHVENQNENDNTPYPGNRPPVIKECNIDYVDGIDSPTVRFYCSARDYDGNITLYHWSVSDGSSSHQPSFTHTFKNPGVYSATLTVIDDDGAKDSRTIQVSIQRP